ncbi:hypothetical protein [Desertibacillus haloalkaliphilus]|uniref:hypothetical protein n=1 Tax=Desertibacillus haloalkaliphilus TaxID=1328930 RepID=UPI001C27D142|nr:hypothetical protein [Desertibacillus haloalkaliphilus]MBU8907558.1 hypothetical protein [Desertibacillus haloalkaliphilus]
MAQKKKKTDDIQEVTYVSDSFVTAFWDNYQSALERARKQIDSQEKAYVRSLKETVKFSQEYRQTWRDLYKKSIDTNRDRVKQLMNNVTTTNDDHQELFSSRATNVTEKVEQITVTPLRATFDFIDRAQEQLADNNEEYVQFLSDRRKSWEPVTDEVVSLARRNHQQFARNVEDRFRPLATMSEQKA